MSEHDDPAIDGFDPEQPESERLEHGRQLAMDSILAAAHQSASAPTPLPRQRNLWVTVFPATAAAFLICTMVIFAIMEASADNPVLVLPPVVLTESSPQLSTRRDQVSASETLGEDGATDTASGPIVKTTPPAGKPADPAKQVADSKSVVPAVKLWSSLVEPAPKQRPVPSQYDIFQVGSGTGSGQIVNRTVRPDLSMLAAPKPAKTTAGVYATIDHPSNTPPKSSVWLRGESYDTTVDNAFKSGKAEQLSTFSIDVDTAAYTNIRDLLSRNTRPPRDAVRVEEMINYFDYDYPQPKGEHPVAIHVDMSQAPWAPQHRLVRIGLQARKAHDDRPPANLVFLIDVSGSMQPQNKLPLLKKCLADLVDSLRQTDRIAIVVYAGAAGVVLESTALAKRPTILAALDRLKSGGSTNGGAGIELAYQIARQNFIDNGINRVILATDGDFNVGISDRHSLISMIEEKRQTGVFLSVLGFGRGNLRDSQMEQLADKGNGAYHYIDSLREGHRVLVDKLDASLMTIAKDVKVQVEFNPRKVAAYRLIGYANRLLRKQDFNDDHKDAGEMGAGQTVTALYEIVPVGAKPAVDALRYSTPAAVETDGTAPDAFAGELMFVKVRYKRPDQQRSQKLTQAVQDDPRSFDSASSDFRFAASVAAFGMLLRDSPHQGSTDFHQVLALAESAMGDDASGLRNEFLHLVQSAQSLWGDRR